MTKYFMHVDLRKHLILLKSQYTIDCCTAAACLHAIELLANMEGIRYNFSMLYVYYMARKIQGTLDLQKCTLKNTFAALETYGACFEQYHPFDKNIINTEPSSDAIFNGVHYKVREYVEVSNVEEYLTQDIPVIIGLSVGALFSGKEYKPVNGTDNKFVSGHAALIVGSNDCGWILANSAGPKWGERGFGILPYECNVDIGEAYAITNFAGITPRKKYKTFDK